MTRNRNASATLACAALVFILALAAALAVDADFAITRQNKGDVSNGTPIVLDVDTRAIGTFVTGEVARAAGGMVSTNLFNSASNSLAQKIYNETQERKVEATVISNYVGAAISDRLTPEENARRAGDAGATNYTYTAYTNLSGRLAAATGDLDRTAANLGTHTNAAALHLATGERSRIEAAVTNESDAASLAALAAYAATNRTTIIYGTNSWTDGDGRVWRIETVTGSTPVGMRMTFTAGATGPGGPVDPLSYLVTGSASALTFLTGTWSPEFFVYTSDINAYFCASAAGGEWNSLQFLWPSPAEFPMTFFPTEGSSGTGTLHIVYSTTVITSRVDSVVYDSTKNLHADSYTNLIWRDVFSNGWHWLVAHTNTAN